MLAVTPAMLIARPPVLAGRPDGPDPHSVCSADHRVRQAGTMPVTEFFDPANLARYLDGTDIARAS
jgi:hypothetical protein